VLVLATAHRAVNIGRYSPSGDETMTRLIAAAVILGLAGCASMKNTPIQDYVLEKGKACESVSSGWRLSRVDTAGNYWISGEGPAGIPLFRQCMAEQYKKQPFNDWLRAQQSQPSSSASNPQPKEAGAKEVAGPPPPGMRDSSAATVGGTVWKPGYTWTYRYESSRESGTFAWIMDREELLDGTTFYVLRQGSREVYVRKSDFAYYIDKVNGEIEIRSTPPFRVVSTTPGEKWELNYVREVPKELTTQNMSRTCESSGPEKITVPAGTFEALKTSCTNNRTGELVLEVWYAPAAMQMIRERALLSYGWRVRELIGIRLYPDRVQ
jgi:hypothetical protein